MAAKIADCWTKELINEALDVNETYYLPYRLSATQKQFEQAYPRSQEFWRIKKNTTPKTYFLILF